MTETRESTEIYEIYGDFLKFEIAGGMSHLFFSRLIIEEDSNNHLNNTQAPTPRTFAST